jgi:aldehyde dehydrogenase (NAD+)
MAHPADRSTWGSTPLTARLAWAARFRAAVVKATPELCAAMQRDTGKPTFEGLTADVVPLLAACRWHERRADRILRERAVRGGPPLMLAVRQRVRFEPVGRVGIIATWNYPVQLLGIELLQALVAGNDVVVKPSEHAPASQALLLELAQSAGLPVGTLRCLAPTREAGAELLREHGPFDHVVFTGSTAVGRRVAEWGAANLVPTTLELSGRDSAFVLSDADPALAARSIWEAVVINSGQTCMAPRRALVDRAVYAPFVAALAPLAAGAAARLLVTPEAANSVFAVASSAVQAGGRPLAGVLEAPRARSLRPIAIADCPVGTALERGEHFGPALAVVPVEGIDEALRIHRACDQHLSASIFTKRPARGRALASSLRATQVTINDVLVPTAHPGGAIGGHGQSGWGLTRGPAGLLAMVRPVYVSRTGWFARFSTAEPPANVSAGLRRFIGWWYR